nr:MAG: hypothetical protein [Podoviridae sp. ctka020]
MTTSTIVKSPYRVTSRPPKSVLPIDRLGYLNELIGQLGEERQKLITQIKKGKSHTVYGDEYIGQITTQNRTKIDRSRIPEKILKEATVPFVVTTLLVKKR